MPLMRLKGTDKVVDIPAGWVSRWPEDYEQPDNTPARPASPARKRAASKKPATSGRKNDGGSNDHT